MGLSSDHASNSGTSIELLPLPIKPQEQEQEAEKLKCPRCDSTNTKFCYFNNYNKSQPRHFCKSCRRYWTAGGTLRNVPIGGARKHKRPKPPPTPTTAAAVATTYQEDFQVHDQTHNDQKLQFPSPSFFPCSGYVSDLYGGSSSGLEETAMAAVEPSLSLSSLDNQPWMYVESTVNSSWVWDDIDDHNFVCSDDVSMNWDDLEID